MNRNIDELERKSKVLENENQLVKMKLSNQDGQHENLTDENKKLTGYDNQIKVF